MNVLTRESALANLRKASDWIAKQEGRRTQPPEDRMLAQNVVLGCRELLGQACADWRGWVFRKPGRLERLRQVKRKYTTKAGNRTVRDLIAFAEGALQAVTWRDKFETVHLPVWKQSRTLTEDHKAKIAAGRKRAHKARQQAIEARLGVDFTRP